MLDLRVWNLLPKELEHTGEWVSFSCSKLQSSMSLFNLNAWRHTFVMSIKLTFRLSSISMDMFLHCMVHSVSFVGFLCVLFLLVASPWWEFFSICLLPNAV